MPLHALARAGLAVTLLLGLVGTAHALTLALSVKRDRFSSSVTDSMPCVAA